MEFLLSLNLGRLIFVFVLFLLYLVIVIKTKRWFFASIFFLLFIFPFNITLQLNDLFGLEYVKGIVSNYTIPTISILDVFVFLLLLSVLMGGVFSKFNSKEKALILFFLVFLSLKAILDFNVLSTLTVYRLFFYIFTIYAAVKYFIEVEKVDEKTRKIFLFTLLSSVIIQTCIGLLQVLRGQSLGLVFLGESQVVKGMFGSSFVDLGGALFLRAYGTFPHPNVLAGYLFFVLFFSIYLFRFWKKNKFYRNVLFLLALFSTFAIFLTLSRLIVFLTVLLWFSVLIQYIWVRKGFVFSFVPPFFIRLFTFENSLTDRIELVKNSLEVLKNNPLLGMGAGRFIYGADYYPVYTAGGFLLLEPVHNIFLLILAEYGLFLGMPLILTIFFVMGMLFFRGDLLIKFFVFSIFVISCLDHYFFTLPQGIFLFFFGLLSIFFFLKRGDFSVQG